MSQLYKDALAADDKWHALLVKYFGNRAGDMRYQKAGEGLPGSDLNIAFLEFQYASAVWRELEFPKV